MTRVLQRLTLVHIKDPYFFHCFTALVVRFLTKRFIGDYEANTGESALYCSVADSLKRNLLNFVTGACYRKAKQC